MARIDPFPSSVIQGISDVLGNVSKGLVHKQITSKFAELHIEENGGENKVERLYLALSGTVWHCLSGNKPMVAATL